MIPAVATTDSVFTIRVLDPHGFQVEDAKTGRILIRLAFSVDEATFRISRGEANFLTVESRWVEDGTQFAARSSNPGNS